MMNKIKTLNKEVVFVKCGLCKDELKEVGLCSCKRMYVSKDICPECGYLVFSYNDPRHDSALGEYCTNVNCNYECNQYMSWHEIKKDYTNVTTMNEEDVVLEVIEEEEEEDNDIIKREVIECCSLIAKERGLNSNTKHVIRYMLEGLVEECNESWCDNCSLRQILGYTCNKLW